MSEMTAQEARYDRAWERGEIKEYDVDVIITAKKTITVEARNENAAETKVYDGEVEIDISDEDITDVEISDFTRPPVILTDGEKSAAKYLKEKGYDVRVYPNFFLINWKKIRR